MALYNASDAPAEVEYVGAQGQGDCALRAYGSPKIFLGSPKAFRNDANFLRQPEVYSFDSAACVIRTTVPPKTTLAIHIVRECTRLADTSSTSPELLRIRIAGAQGAIERSGIDAAKLFQRGPSGTCLYTYG
jgi:hypothetical protein